MSGVGPSNMAQSRSAGVRILRIKSSEIDLKAALDDPKVAEKIMSNLNTVIQLRSDDARKD